MRWEGSLHAYVHVGMFPSVQPPVRKTIPRQAYMNHQHIKTPEALKTRSDDDDARLTRGMFRHNLNLNICLL